MSVTMTIKGLGALERKLSRLPEGVARNVAKPALEAGARPVEEEAKRRAPVGATGRGRASIESRFNREGNTEWTVRVGPSAKTMSSRRDGFYLLFIERGTVPRFTKGGAFRGQLRPAPFLRPALDSQSRLAVDIVRRELWRGIEREAR